LKVPVQVHFSANLSSQIFSGTYFFCSTPILEAASAFGSWAADSYIRALKTTWFFEQTKNFEICLVQTLYLQNVMN